MIVCACPDPHPPSAGWTPPGPLGAIIGAMGCVLPTVLLTLCFTLGGGDLSPFGVPSRLALLLGLAGQAFAVFRGNTPVMVVGAGVASCVVAGCAYMEHRTGPRLVERLLAAETVGAVVGSSGVLAGAIGRLAGKLGWDLNAAAAWPRLSGPKAILFHRGDMMIDYYLASLHMKAQEKSGGLQRTRCVELAGFGRHGRHPACHMYPLTEDPAEWREVIGVTAQMLGIGAHGTATVPGYGLTSVDMAGVVKRAAPVATGRGLSGEARAQSMQSVVQRGGGQHIPLHLNKGAVDPAELYQVLLCSGSTHLHNSAHSYISANTNCSLIPTGSECCQRGRQKGVSCCMGFDESGSNAVHVGCAAHAAQGLRRRPIPIVLSLHSTGRANIARSAGFSSQAPIALPGA